MNVYEIFVASSQFQGEVLGEVIAESEQEGWLLGARREGFHPDLDYGIYDIRLKGPYPQASQWYEDEVVEVGNDK